MKFPDRYDFDSCFEIAAPLGFLAFCVSIVCFLIGWAAVKILFLGILALLVAIGFVFGFAWLFAFAVVNYEDWHDRRNGR